MNRIIEICSAQNPLVKELVSYQKASNREQSASFLIEGIREVEKAIKAGYEISKVIFNQSYLIDLDLFKNLSDQCDLIQMDKKVFSKFACRDRVDNIVAVASLKSHHLVDLKLPEKPLIIVLESVEKPGNIGAVLRTCDAAGVDAVFICDAKTDLYNPNVVRSSLGCLFTNQIVVCSSSDAVTYFKENNIQVYVSHLESAENFFGLDYKQPTALVLGAESSGVSDYWLHAADQRIKIPMRGEADSMNVSNAAAVMIYEAFRQRSIQ